MSHSDETDDPTEDADDHPLGTGLAFDDDLTAEELREQARTRTQSDLLDSTDPRLAKVAFTFVDEDGIKRTWAVTHDNFDSDNYADTETETETDEGTPATTTEYQLTDADGEPIPGESYTDRDRALDARAQLMATHEDGDDVTVEPAE